MLIVNTNKNLSSLSEHKRRLRLYKTICPISSKNDIAARANGVLPECWSRLESSTARKSIKRSENVPKSLHYSCGRLECFPRKFLCLAMRFEYFSYYNGDATSEDSRVCAEESYRISKRSSRRWFSFSFRWIG